ncbi:G3BP isoform X1 [Olea europaea subsp. europaea]|uniref:G3BP isoform X1 n=1 Tax=Olea europaea subsp. europaea TaxID=158383 RepID=A0A8S0RHK8_OLEEU|nr:G3BP isoform X1 [Olea europaea subsp. europaea]
MRIQAINEKILSLNYGDLRSKINTVDPQESFNGGAHVLVTGYLSGKGNTFRNFCQTFFLIPQYYDYFVLNDIFLYMGIFNVNPAVVSDVLRPITPEPTYGGEASTLYEIVDVPIVEEEIPKEEIRVAEFLMKYGKIFQMVVESSPQIEEVQKKSYASIATHLKESTANFSLPPHDPQKAPPKITEQVNTHLPPPTDAPFLVLLQLILGIIKMGTLGEGSNLGGVLDSEMRERQDAELVAESGRSDGYQKADNINGNVDRMSGRAGGMVSGAAKTVAPWVEIFDLDPSEAKRAMQDMIDAEYTKPVQPNLSSGERRTGTTKDRSVDFTSTSTDPSLPVEKTTTPLLAIIDGRVGHSDVHIEDDDFADTPSKWHNPTFHSNSPIGKG